MTIDNFRSTKTRHRNDAAFLCKKSDLKGEIKLLSLLSYEESAGCQNSNAAYNSDTLNAGIG